ncbi:MAG: glycosyltransferase family 39 protein [Vicinamibacteria bacterium]|nr:glycosyltransferase family 39 protein [Vicinamibacteria bacterium]
MNQNQDPRVSSFWPQLAVILLLGLFLLQGISTIGATSPTTDEPGHYRYGHRILRGVAARWDDSKMPASALNALPCFVSERIGSPVRDAGEFAGPCDWTLARLPTLLGGLALGLALASWSRALFGWSGAAVSLGLFAFDPNFLAHSTLVTTDVFGALFLLLSLRAFARWLEVPRIRNSVLLGLAVGAAFISKYTAAFLPVICVVAAILCRGRVVGRAKAQVGWASGAAIALAIALAVINVGFLGDETGASLRDQRFESPQFRELSQVPLLSSLPLPVPRPFVEGLDRVFHREREGGGSGNIYLLGELRAPGSDGFPSYFLIVGFFKTPIPTLLALALALFLFVKRGRASWNVDEVTLASAVVMLSLYFSLLFRAQIGFRHYLVAVPPMFVLAGALGPWLSQTRGRLAIGVVGLCLSAGSVTRHGRDPLSYFNELVDPTLTYTIAADSNLEWGQTAEEVEAYLAAHPDVLRAPAKPFPGRLLVGANQLTGVVTRRRMEWLRDSRLRPIGHVAFTHFLFEVSDAEAGALRLEQGDPPLPPG